MTQRMRNRLIEILMLVVLGLAAAAVMPRGYAAMIPTDAAQAPAGPDAERARLKAILARPAVAAGLQKFGINADEAKARVDALSDDEVAQLAARIDALPAGGALTNDELIVILLLVIILVLLL
jgi:hypothetical protein